MLRRNLFKALLAGATGWFGARAVAAQPAARLKVAYHLSDVGKVGFVLGNIRNHFEGTGGNVDIVLVVHGPALAAFKSAATSTAVKNRFSGLRKQGLQAHACGNTLRGMDLAPGDLVEGFVVVEEGGVVKLAALQAQGYAYLRP